MIWISYEVSYTKLFQKNFENNVWIHMYSMNFKTHDLI